MFLSKIWFFLVAVAGVTALTIALLLPRPSERLRMAEERQRITTACNVFNIQLKDYARKRIDLVGKFARVGSVADAIRPANKVDEIKDSMYKAGRAAASELLDSTDDSPGTKPSFIILLDNDGRVVARLGVHDKHYGDSMAGFYLVADALAGYLRDDLWVIENELYLVAGSPVIGSKYVGAIIIGHKMDTDLAKLFVDPLGVNVQFYADGELMGGSSAISMRKSLLEEFGRVSSAENPLIEDCNKFEPFPVEVGSDIYATQIARLPGEVGARGGFFAVYVQRPGALGVMGTLSTAKQEDLSFDNFPWIMMGLGFVLVVAVGMLLMIFESDRPLRRLSAAAVKLAKDESDRFDEDAHRGKFGSVARAVNIRLDKMEREAKAKKTDLDDLLGPPSASALPLAGLGGPAKPSKPPPPSEFKFNPTPGQPVAPTRPATAPPIPGSSGRASTPPPVPMATPAAPPAPAGFADDASASDAGDALVEDAPTGDAAAEPVADPDEEATFRRVFQEFLQTKKDCGESTNNLTYEKFAGKLRKNRDALKAKHGCSEVKFQVYVKDGKAALKATPVKDS